MSGYGRCPNARGLSVSGDSTVIRSLFCKLQKAPIIPPSSFLPRTFQTLLFLMGILSHLMSSPYAYGWRPVQQMSLLCSRMELHYIYTVVILADVLWELNTAKGIDHDFLFSWCLKSRQTSKQTNKQILTSELREEERSRFNNMSGMSPFVWNLLKTLWFLPFSFLVSFICFFL